MNKILMAVVFAGGLAGNASPAHAKMPKIVHTVANAVKKGGGAVADTVKKVKQLDDKTIETRRQLGLTCQNTGLGTGCTK
jgi:hypothetical protein